MVYAVYRDLYTQVSEPHEYVGPSGEVYVDNIFCFPLHSSFTEGEALFGLAASRLGFLVDLSILGTGLMKKLT